MIVDPDFLDHWRTRMVVDALDGDEMAPLCVLRLWAHCQSRKSDRFEMPTAGLKAQCRYKGDAQKFEQALTEAGFIKREGIEVHVLGWAEQNASLIAAWENGAKGGRPRTKPVENPQETQGKPNGNQDETQAKPIREEEIREEKKREEKQKTTAQPTVALPDWMPIASWSGYIEMRKKKRKDPTARAVELLIAELERLRDEGQDIAAVLDKSTVNGWTDVYPLKLEPQARGSPGNKQLDLAAAQKAANEEAKRRLFGNDDGRTIDA